MVLDKLRQTFSRPLTVVQDGHLSSYRTAILYISVISHHVVDLRGFLT